MRVWEQVIIATHKPSRNIKLYKTTEFAEKSISQSQDPDMRNWKIEKEYVWSEK
jgi:hypothetical protein